MRANLAKGDYAEFYRKWCHPYIAAQLTSDKFVEYMRSDRGKAVIRLHEEVLQAVDSKAGPEVLIAQPQEKEGQFEFILVSVKAMSTMEKGGRQWHLELELDNGQWKLMDTD